MKISHFVKVLVCSVFTYLFVSFDSIKERIFYKNPVVKYSVKQNNFKYILIWTKNHTEPLSKIGEGQNIFIKSNCSKTNCFVKSYQEFQNDDVTKYDAIVFYGPVISYCGILIPDQRLSYQKYIFASVESPIYYPICSYDFESFFNWTWTYKLDSDIRYGYFVVRDVNDTVIGPNVNMHWLKLYEMDPVTEEIKNKLREKERPVAWFVSNCETPGKREDFAEKLSRELFDNFGYTVDVYGECGIEIFNVSNKEAFDKILNKYYFYLSFENSLSDDYVTEKLLRPLQNFVVPIVFGGANYTRFLPDGAYLNARVLGVKKLAKTIDYLIEDREEYAKFFKWTNHYKYFSTSERNDTNPYCKLCEMLNDEGKVKETKVISDFRYWWNHLRYCDSLINWVERLL